MSLFGNDGGNSDFGGTQILSQSNGGGGYLNDSMVSDMAGGSTGMGMTPAKNKMSVPNDPAMVPCTIKQIKNAPAPAQDDSFAIDEIVSFNFDFDLFFLVLIC